MYTVVLLTFSLRFPVFFSLCLVSAVKSGIMTMSLNQNACSDRDASGFF